MTVAAHGHRVGKSNQAPCRPPWRCSRRKAWLRRYIHSSILFCIFFFLLCSFLAQTGFSCGDVDYPASDLQDRLRKRSSSHFPNALHCHTLDNHIDVFLHDFPYKSVWIWSRLLLYTGPTFIIVYLSFYCMHNHFLSADFYSRQSNICII
jgi:hypothetical protein